VVNVYAKWAKCNVCYTAKFKFEVVQYAQEHVNRAVGRKSDVYEMNVSQWSGEKEKPEGISKKKCAFHGKKCRYPHGEAKLHQYVMKNDLQYR
jgi:hypothetical protein